MGSRRRELKTFRLPQTGRSRLAAAIDRTCLRAAHPGRRICGTCRRHGRRSAGTAAAAPVKAGRQVLPGANHHSRWQGPPGPAGPTPKG
jgi:hypothetical protein